MKTKTQNFRATFSRDFPFEASKGAVVSSIVTHNKINLDPRLSIYELEDALIEINFPKTQLKDDLLSDCAINQAGIGRFDNSEEAPTILIITKADRRAAHSLISSLERVDSVFFTLKTHRATNTAIKPKFFQPLEPLKIKTKKRESRCSS
jgi:hypothetical protein